MTTRIPFRAGVLLAGCFAVTAAFCFANPSRRPQRARAAYQRAAALRERLEAKPARLRKKADYEKAIREFHNVYWNDFAYAKAPVAAQAVGDLYAEMGRKFSAPSYFQRAVKAYRFLITQYPQSSMAREAALSLGKIYLSDLNDPQQAAQVFQSILKKHPRSSEAREARKGLKEAAHARAEQRTEASHSASARREEETASVRENVSTHQTSRGLVEVTDIHDWVGPNYTRVVIGAQAPVKYDALRLTHPDRIVFDLPNTRVNRALLRKAFSVDGHFLRDIRVGQFRPRVTRVVLEVANFENYTVFPLPNPFRLIIDVRGLPPRGTERARKAVTAASPEGVQQASAPRAVPPRAGKTAGSSRIETKTDAARKAKPGETEATEFAATAPLSPSAGQEEEPPISAKPAAPTKNGDQTLTRALGLKVARIVIDPGHGGQDTGTIGPTGLEEKNVVLDIGLRLRKLIETRTDSEVFMTRSTDKFIPLEERTAIANEDRADLFISIHANASRDHHVRGIETYFLNFTRDPEALQLAARENATSQESVYQLQNLIKKIALNNKIEESQELARDVQRDLYRDMSRVSPGIHNRGVRKAPFVVLIGANMPSILTEISFLSNPRSERLLRRASYREKIAEAIFQGIESYVDNLGTIRMAQRTR